MRRTRPIGRRLSFSVKAGRRPVFINSRWLRRPSFLSRNRPQGGADGFLAASKQANDAPNWRTQIWGQYRPTRAGISSPS